MSERQFICLCLVALVLVVAPDVVFASTTSGGGLPWETPLGALKDSIKGPVAYGISMLGIIAAGFALLFGGEINDFVRRLIYVVGVISLILMAEDILSKLFPSAAGAVLQ